MIINIGSIDYAFRPRLRSRLTLGGITFPRKPWVFGDKDSHLINRYSSRHIHFFALHGPSRNRFAAAKNALLPLFRAHSFGILLFPDHYRRWIPRPVSCYALFKWWLLLSQHPGCHSNPTSFRTQQNLGTLAGDQDCSPFDDGYCHSPSISQTYTHGIRSLVGPASLSTAQTIQ